MLQERAEEELVNRHLRLEVETLKAPARIERVATGRLKMVAYAGGFDRDRASGSGAGTSSVGCGASVGRNGDPGGRKNRQRLARDAQAEAYGRLLRVARVVGRHPGRLIHLQVLRYTDLTSRADRQQSRTIPSPAKRGEILDRNGRILARSVDADDLRRSDRTR